MKNVVILFAGDKPGFNFEKKFDSLSAFEKSLEWASSVPGSIKTLVLAGGETLSRMEQILPKNGSVEAVPGKDWTRGLLAEEIARLCKENSADYAVFAWADCPFLNKSLTQQLISAHEEYRAEYTFADGFSYGFAPEIIDGGAAAIIAELAKTSQKTSGDSQISRDALFSIMSGDINSFEIETVLADKDYRLLRLNFECTTKAGFVSCLRLFEKSKKQKKNLSSADFDVYEISDLAEQSPEIQQSLPAFYNLQISNAYNTKSLYCPYEKLFSDRKMPLLPLNEFKTLVKKISDYSGQAVVGLSLFGEPSLHPDFADFALEVLNYPDLKLFIETDGLSFSEAHIKKIALAAKDSDRIDFAVRLDATDEKMYETVNGRNGSDFKKVLDFISLLGKTFPGHVYPQFTRMNANEEQLETFFRFWNEKTSPSGGQFVITKYDSCAGLLSDEKPADLSPLERNACWHLRRDMHILSDGTVPLCKARISETVGNALEEPLETIWNKVQKEVLNHINQNYCEKCRACDEYYTFNF